MHFENFARAYIKITMCVGGRGESDVNVEGGGGMNERVGKGGVHNTLHLCSVICERPLALLLYGLKSVTRGESGQLFRFM